MMKKGSSKEGDDKNGPNEQRSNIYQKRSNDLTSARKQYKLDKKAKEQKIKVRVKQVQ